MIFLTVIPGRREAARPESITTIAGSDSKSPLLPNDEICRLCAAVLASRRGNKPCPLNIGGVPCASIAISKTSPAFSISRKRRKSFPSETHVKRGRRFVRGDIELIEKLGRNDLCPCGSGRRFQDLLHEVRSI